MKRLLVFGLIATTVAACTKDKFKTIPQVEIKSFGPDEVFKGQLIHLNANVTDKEGDLQDSVIFYRKVFAVNTRTLVSQDSSIRANLKTLAVPNKQEIEVQLNMIYGESNQNYPTQNGSNAVDRLLTVGMYIKDVAGNRSEYVESDTIRLKRIQ